MKIKLTKFLSLFICLVLVFSLCSCREETKLSKEEFLFDTIVSITYYDEKDTKAVEGAFSLMHAYDKMFSKTNTESEVYRLNTKGRLTVSPELYGLIKSCKEFSVQTNGAFDITVYALSALWDYKKEVLPKEADIQAAKKTVGYTNISLYDHNLVILKNHAKIDLGAVAKGYISQKVKEYLEKSGVTSAVISLGGNIALVGEKQGGESFRVGIKKPFDTQGALFGAVALKDKYAVTSGIYERYFKDAQGKIYHHIIDPKTGYPKGTDIYSVTILGESGTVCDFLSTAVILLGKENSKALLKEYGVDWLIIYSQGNYETSENFKQIYNLKIY